MTTPDAQTIRAVLTAQAETRQALKVARARSFLGSTEGGVKVSDAWQIVELETADEAVAAFRADIEAKVLWASLGHHVMGVMSEGGPDA